MRNLSSPKEFALVALIYMGVAYIIWSILEPWTQSRLWLVVDNQNYFLEMIEYGINRLAEGDFPHWNPYQGGGVPFFAALQAMVLYPPTWLAAVFSAETTYMFTKYLHLVLSGFSIYFYLRVINLHPLAAICGGLFYMTGNFYLAFTVFGIGAYPLATVGILLGAIEKILRTTSRPTDEVANRWSLVFVLVMTLQVFSGYIQAVVFTGYFLCLYIPFRMGQRYFDGQRYYALVPVLMRFGCMALITLMLSSVQLLPTLEMSIQSGTHNLQSGMDALQLKNTSTLVTPSFFDNLTDSVVPISQVPGNIFFWCLVAGGLLFYKKKRSLVIFYSATSFFFLNLACGPDTWLYQLYYHHFPTGNWFRWPEKFLLISNLTVSILVALGLHQCHQFLSQSKNRPAHYAFWFYCFSIISIAFLSRYSVAAVQIQIQDMRWQAFGRDFPPYQVSRLLRSVKHLLDNPAKFQMYAEEPHLEAQEALNFLRDQNENHRVFSLLVINPETTSDLPVKWGMREKQYSIEDYEPLTSARKLNFADEMGSAVLFHLALPKNMDMMALFSTKWLLVSQNWREKNPARKIPKDLLQVYADEHYQIYEFPQTVPRSYVSYNIVGLPDDEALKYLSKNSFDPYSDVTIDDGFVRHRSAESEAIQSATITSYEPENVVIELPRIEREGLLVLTDNYDKNWRAAVDGKESEVVPVNYLFRGVKIFPGDREVTFYYYPVYFYWGAAISFFAIVLIALFHLLIRSSKKKG
ncbi:MAG: YfhO family protein [Halioglobus sp.]|nr:YfhO family protein [Halioglobus sp.]